MKLQVQNIGKAVNAHSLGAIFSTYGKVESITIFSNVTITNNNKMAHVMMPNDEEAAAAIEQLNGCFVDGYALAVSPVVPEKKSLLISFYKRFRYYLAPKEKNLSLL